MARSSVAAVMLNVTGSTSANTGVSPATRAISGMTQKVSAGKTTSLPAREVERLQDVEERHPSIRGGHGARMAEAPGECGSKSATCGPSTSCPCRSSAATICSVSGMTRTP